ncbi:MAG: hypothetical protein PHD15_04405 [Clostridia bacterium]|nr:hypothetical protein [Clostridia bacterium]MDD4386981.1 hypothetical protein [Clostridia bacterium]
MKVIKKRLFIGLLFFVCLIFISTINASELEYASENDITSTKKYRL